MRMRWAGSMQMRWLGRAGERYADEWAGPARAGEEPLLRRPPGTGRRPALSLTGADPPDAAASPAGAGVRRSTAETLFEAASRPLPEPPEHGQPLGAARGPRTRSVRWAGVAPRPLRGRAPFPHPLLGQRPPRCPRAPRGRGKVKFPGCDSCLWNALVGL